jgi:hypothetical protein
MVLHTGRGSCVGRFSGVHKIRYNTIRYRTGQDNIRPAVAATSCALDFSSPTFKRERKESRRRVYNMRAQSFCDIIDNLLHC